MLRQLPFVDAWSPTTKAPTVRRLPLANAGLPNRFGAGGAAMTGQVAQMQAYGDVGWLFAAVSRIAQSVASAEWKLYAKKANGEREEVMNHPLSAFWENPTPFDTGDTFREQTQQYMDLTGESWWVLVGSEDGRPAEMQVIRPDRMRVIPDRQQYISGYVYQLGSERIPLLPEQVVFMRMPSPLDPYRGMGPVGSLLWDLGSEKMAAQYTRNFYANSAEPGGIIQFDENISDPDFDRLVTRWQQQHTGVSNAHRVAILERGTWVDRKGSTAREMQQGETRRGNRDIILGALGIPLSILGITESVNRANAEAAEVTYARWTVKPRLSRIRGYINKTLVPFWDSSGTLEMDYVDPTPEDREFNLREATEGKTARILTLNESRRRLGEGEMEGGDELDEKPEPPPVMQPGVNNAPPGADEEEQDSRALSGAVITRANDPLLPPPVDLAEAKAQAAWARRLAQEANAIAEHVVPFMKHFTKLEPADLDNYDWDWWEKYSDEVIEELVNLFTVSIVADFPDMPVPELQRLAGIYARQRGAELLRLDGDINVVQMTRRRVNELVAKSIENGDSLQALQKGLREDFCFSPTRASTVARTETAQALGQGQMKAAQSVGRDEKSWITQGDDHVDKAQCEVNERQGWIKLTDPFTSGHDTVPAHPNCRCVVIYRTSNLHSTIPIDPTEGLAEENAAAVAAANPRSAAGPLVEVHCPDCNSRLPIRNFRGSADVWCKMCHKLMPFTTLPVEVVDKKVLRDDQGNLIGIQEARSVG